MKKFFDKCKQWMKTSEFKANFWTILLTIFILIPFIILFITIMMQFSYLTSFFWIAILIMLIVLVVTIAFSGVIYAKLYNNYMEKSLLKKEYLSIFLKELIGPLSLGLFITGIIIFIDQLTKLIAINELLETESVVFIKNFLNWRLAYNKGAAWSMCSGHMNILAIVSLIATFVILYFMKDFDIKKRPLYSIAISFMLGGTIGNMIDRFFRFEGVVDFIELGFMEFPIADSFLVVGTILLMISIILIDGTKNKKTDKNLKIEEVDFPEQPNSTDVLSK